MAADHPSAPAVLPLIGHVDRLGRVWFDDGIGDGHWRTAGPHGLSASAEVVEQQWGPTRKVVLVDRADWEQITMPLPDDVQEIVAELHRMAMLGWLANDDAADLIERQAREIAAALAENARLRLVAEAAVAWYRAIEMTQTPAEAELGLALLRSGALSAPQEPATINVGGPTVGNVDDIATSAAEPRTETP